MMPSYSLRNCFLLDGDVGTLLAKWLIYTYHDDIYCFVVTDMQNRICDIARDSNIRILHYNTFLNTCEENIFDFGFLIWWPYLVPSTVLKTAKNGFINTHPSFLPHCRGKHYNFWTLVEEAPFGVSLHFVEEGIDSGDIIAQTKIPYTWEDTGESLFKKAQAEMCVLLKKEYPLIREQHIRRVPQEKNGSFHYARELDPKSRILLDTPCTARELLNLLRARTFIGHPACTFEENGKTYEVRVSITEKPNAQ